jgi:hypothetical protein
MLVVVGHSAGSGQAHTFRHVHAAVRIRDGSTVLGSIISGLATAIEANGVSASSRLAAGATTLSTYSIRSTYYEGRVRRQAARHAVLVQKNTTIAQSPK